MNNEYESGLYGTNIKYFENVTDYDSYVDDDSNVLEVPNVAYIEDSSLVVYDWIKPEEDEGDWDPDEVVLTMSSNPTIFNILKVIPGLQRTDSEGYTIGDLQAITLDKLTSDGDSAAGPGNSVSKFWCYNFHDGTDWTNPPQNKMWTFDEFKYFTSIIEIPYDFFSNCHGLTSITIPSSVIDIYSRAFHDCWWLTNIKVMDSAQSLTVEDMDYNNFSNRDDFNEHSAFCYTGVFADTNFNHSKNEESISNYLNVYDNAVERVIRKGILKCNRNIVRVNEI